MNTDIASRAYTVSSFMTRHRRNGEVIGQSASNPWIMGAQIRLNGDIHSINVFRLDLRQKGVDMRIGLDIASLAYKGQISQLILISGDSDFVPAAKLARREGIDFVLDPMWSTIRSDLHEHIDGLRSVCPKPCK
jgi:uncharacterized LabA/DUF88 family protein